MDKETKDVSTIRDHGGTDIVTVIRYTATCRYCGRMIECLNADFLLTGKEVPDRVHPHAVEHRMDWAHREGVGQYRLECLPEQFVGEYDGMGGGRHAKPREGADGNYSAQWTIIVSVNGEDKFGVHTSGRESAKELMPKIMIWNV